MSSHKENILQEVESALRQANTSLPAFEEVVANQDVLVFLGNTRSGKSTLINYILKTKLVSFEERRTIYKIKKANENDPGPTIGQGSVSCTSVPGLYRLTNPAIVIVDTPGFDDNRSQAQDIVNALYINHIKHARSAKFVLVSDINDISMDNIQGFTSLLQRAYSLFPRFENMMHSVTIIFTKENRGYSHTDFAEVFKKKILNSNDLVIQKELVQNFADNLNAIGIFKMPTTAEEITHSLDDNIETIYSVTPMENLQDGNLKIALSSKSRLLLLQIYQYYLDTDYFKNELERKVNIYRDYLDIHDYIFASTNDELNDALATLTHLENLFQGESKKTFINIDDIQASLLRISPFNMTREFSRVLTVLVAINHDIMEDAIKEKFVKKYQYGLTAILEKIRKILSKINEEIRQRQVDHDIFVASAATAGAGGGAAVLSEIGHQLLSTGGRLTSPLGWISIAAGVIGAVATGAAVASSSVANSKQQRRIEARVRQGRDIYPNMFSDD